MQYQRRGNDFFIGWAAAGPRGLARRGADHIFFWEEGGRTTRRSADGSGMRTLCPPSVGDTYARIFLKKFTCKSTFCCFLASFRPSIFIKGCVG